MLKIWTGASGSKLKKDVVPQLKERLGVDGFSFTSLKEAPPHLTPDDVLLVMGTQGLERLQKAGLCPKGRTVASMRGKEIPIDASVALVTYDPGIVNLDYSKYVDMQIDLSLATRRVLTGTLQPKVGHYRWVEDLGDCFAFINQRWEETKKPTPVALDLETVGLNPYDPDKWIVSLSVTYKKGMADLLYFEKDKQPTGQLMMEIASLLNSDSVHIWGANLKYDRLWMRVKWNVDCTNQSLDTTLLGSLLDENRSNSLNTHAKVYTSMGGYDDEFNATHDKGAMHEVPKEDLLPYAGGDTDACYRTGHRMKNDLLKDQALTRFYVELMQPAATSLQYMEETGLLIDVPYYMELQSELTNEMKRIESMALKMIPKRLQLKHRGNLKLTRAAIIKDFMFSARGLNLTPKMLTGKTEEPSTAKKHLAMFADHEDAKAFLDLLQEYSSAGKTLGTYVTGFLKHLRPDGRFHATAILYKGDYGGEGDSGTVTGRLAFKDPAVQTIPKHTSWADRLRRGYIAPPGYVLVNFDYSQGELKIAACLANEPTMLKMYSEGIDLHMVTGFRLNGYDPEEANVIKEQDPKLYKMLRQGGKAGNFGLIYGMSAGGYRIYARDTYGVHLSEAEAAMQRDSFFDLFAGLPDWHTKYKKIARMHSQVRSPLGRIRHLPLINSNDQEVRARSERQSINSPVQATLSDLTQYSLTLFHRRYGRPTGFQPCLTTHDSLSAYVKEDEVDIWVPRMTDIMENLPLREVFGWNHQIPFTTDAEIGLNLADMQEVA